MPTDEENTQFLYLVLTNGGEPTIDWDAVGNAMKLNKGAVSKRWSRLNKAAADGENPGPAALEFLWHCVANSTREKALAWADIARKCNTTSGAAAKRYSRMKLAYEKNGVLPTSSKATKSTANGSATADKKGKGTSSDGGKPKANDSGADSNTTTTTPTKRKRAPAKKKVVEDALKFKPGPEDGDDEKQAPQKKQKRTQANTAKPRAAPKPKVPTTSWTASGSVNPTEATTLIKSEPDGTKETVLTTQHEDGEEFYDGSEEVDGEEQQARVKDWLETSTEDYREEA